MASSLRSCTLGRRELAKPCLPVALGIHAAIDRFDATRQEQALQPVLCADNVADELRVEAIELAKAGERADVLEHGRLDVARNRLVLHEPDFERDPLPAFLEEPRAVPRASSLRRVRANHSTPSLTNCIGGEAILGSVSGHGHESVTPGLHACSKCSLMDPWDHAPFAAHVHRGASPWLPYGTSMARVARDCRKKRPGRRATLRRAIRPSMPASHSSEGVSLDAAPDRA